MTSLRAVFSCVHSASFVAITVNATSEFKRMQGMYLLLYFSWYYRSAEKWQPYPPHFPPHTSAEQGICGKADSTIDQVSVEYCLKYFVATGGPILYQTSFTVTMNWCKMKFRRCYCTASSYSICCVKSKEQHVAEVKLGLGQVSSTPQVFVYGCLFLF